MCVHVCVCLCVFVHVCVCVCLCVHVWLSANVTPLLLHARPALAFNCASFAPDSLLFCTLIYSWQPPIGIVVGFVHIVGRFTLVACERTWIVGKSCNGSLQSIGGGDTGHDLMLFVCVCVRVCVCVCGMWLHLSSSKLAKSCNGSLQSTGGGDTGGVSMLLLCLACGCTCRAASWKIMQR
jgi:hypothetical protein